LIAKRKGENFGRVKCSTLAKFLGEVHHEESVFGLVQNSEKTELDKENWDAKSSTGSVLSIGQESVSSAVTCTTEMLGVTADTKFILLDLREEEDYKKWHIRESISFPAPNITRDKTFGQLLRFKNNPDKIIVVYMYDERSGTQYAKILFEKGFDNVYLLSGGVDKFYEDHNEFVEGTDLPALPKPKTAMGSTKTSKFTKTATTLGKQSTTSIKK
jgi:centrosomal protein CEP41